MGIEDVIAINPKLKGFDSTTSNPVFYPRPENCTILFRDYVMSAMKILPEHAHKDIKPESMRGHTVGTWLGSFTVKTTDGKAYTAHGGIGTGPWIARGHDPTKNAYKFVKNPNYWEKTSGNVETYYVVNVQGSDALLSALEAGAIDGHDPMYGVESLVKTIDPGWGEVLKFDSYKWQHICFNLKRPVFGTGVGIPPGQTGSFPGGRGGG